MKQYYSLCTPAKVYFLLTFVSILGLLYQNAAAGNSYKVGTYKVKLQHHNFFFFFFKIIYMLVWTFILNQLCSHGYSKISWFLVLLPLLLMFVIIGLNYVITNYI